jgi:hypothetical protein
MLGDVEDERYISIALYQGVPKVKRKTGITDFAMGQEVVTKRAADPVLVACALARQRFYLFSRREPADVDDVTQVTRRTTAGLLLPSCSPRMFACMLTRSLTCDAFNVYSSLSKLRTLEI